MSFLLLVDHHVISLEIRMNIFECMVHITKAIIAISNNCIESEKKQEYALSDTICIMDRIYSTNCLFKKKCNIINNKPHRNAYLG